MARIRTIKPEFFTSEDIVSLTPLARLFYIGLWCEADREGRLEFKPGTLKLRYLPTDDVDINEIVKELTSKGLLVEYQVESEKFALIPKFTKHQVINSREAQSKLPSLHDTTCNYMQLHENTKGKGREGKGKEGKGREQSTHEELNSTLYLSFDRIDEELNQQTFQDITCMNMGFDPDSFKKFTRQWLKKKQASTDYHYPLNKLKSFLISDFEKQPKPERKKVPVI